MVFWDYDGEDINVKTLNFAVSTKFQSEKIDANAN